MKIKTLIESTLLLYYIQGRATQYNLFFEKYFNLHPNPLPPQ